MSHCPFWAFLKEELCLLISTGNAEMRSNSLGRIQCNFSWWHSSSTNNEFGFSSPHCKSCNVLGKLILSSVPADWVEIPQVFSWLKKSNPSHWDSKLNCQKGRKCLKDEQKKSISQLKRAPSSILMKTSNKMSKLKNDYQLPTFY